jgi:hypothetical protein
MTLEIKKQLGYFFAFILIALGLGLNISHLWDANLWGDECFSVLLSDKSYWNVVLGTAKDVHPPLYYFILKFVETLLGRSAFVFHFVSFIPMIFSLFLSWLWMRKRFGFLCMFIFDVLLLFSPMSLQYASEVRMYSWAAFFLLAAFAFLYEILKTEKKKYMAGFVLCSLAAAYCHYYCLIMAACLYVFLLAYAFFVKKELIRPVLILYAVTILGYTPWLFVFIPIFLKVSRGFWIAEIPSVKDLLEFPFGIKAEILVWLVLLILCVMNAVRYWKDNLQTKWIKLGYAAAGLSSFALTALIGYAVCYLICPLFLLRYLFSACYVLYFCIALLCRNVPGTKLFALFFTAFALFFMLPLDIASLKEEKALNDDLLSLLEQTEPLIDEETTLYSSLSHFSWSIQPYYYPNAKDYLTYTPEELVQSDLRSGDLLYLYFNQNYEEYQEQLAQKGFTLIPVVLDSNLGTMDVCVYQIEEVQK